MTQTGTDPEQDLPGTLPAWAAVTPKRLGHIRRVAALVDQWAQAMAVPLAERDRWLRAVWLHDALRDADEVLLRRLAADDADGPLELLHGPAAATRASQEGERDEGILSAVRYHSVGHAGWDWVGRVLYCADFLEPGRSFDPEERAELARRFPTAPNQVLAEVVRRRLGWMVRSGWSIPEVTWRFWNALAAGESP